MTTFDTHPDTRTVAAGWSSSPLGHPDDIFLLDEPADVPAETADPVAEARPAKRMSPRAIAAVALLGGIVGGTLLGLTFSDHTPDAPVVVGPISATPPPEAVPTPHVRILPPAAVNQPAAVVPAPSTAEVSLPPAAVAPAETAVVDVPAPEAPADETPQPPAEPQPQPQPEPPVLDGIPFDPPQPPQPQPPVFEPDLPLTPAPAPQPQPDPVPDLDIKAGPTS